jgi:hypothetical protein
MVEKKYKWPIKRATDERVIVSHPTRPFLLATNLVGNAFV